MPIPFLLAGLGVAAGVLGAGGHLSAKETNENAQRISQEAQDLYNNAKESLEQAQNKTEKELLKLGTVKKHTLDTSMNQFLNAFEKVKDIQFIESTGINEISKFTIDQQEAIELRKMTDIYSSTAASGAAGGAAGALVALAASGSLTVVTGGLTTAGSLLMAGEVSAAAGIAGSALSFGAAMTPLAAIAAPVILFTGISASMKAEENLEKANTMYAQAEAASEQMKVSELLCDAISERSDMFHDLLVDLNGMFSECSSLMAGLIRKKEGRVFKKKLKNEDFTEEEMKLMAVTGALAKAVKSVIDTPILSKDGNISYESEEVYEQTVDMLPVYSQSFEDVKSIDYHVKPVKVKTVESSSSHADSSSGTSVLNGARKVFAFVFGVILANAVSGNIALLVSNDYNKFLFLNAFTANKIAIWTVICASVMMLIGKFGKSNVGKLCGIGTGIGLPVLYVQYCRTVTSMDHYIIFSIIVLLVCGGIVGVFEGKEEKWSCGSYFYNMGITLGSCPILFLIYAFFSKLIGISDSFCLIATSVLMFLISLSLMSGLADE